MPTADTRVAAATRGRNQIRQRGKQWNLPKGGKEDRRDRHLSGQPHSQGLAQPGRQRLGERVTRDHDSRGGRDRELETEISDESR